MGTPRAALARSKAELGAHAFLEKPFSLAAVRAAVDDALAPGNDVHEPM